jgi:hypothetical protein
VYEAVQIDSPKWAESLEATPKFKTCKFQIEMRRKFRERLFCFVERIVFGEARRQLQKKGVAEMHLCRSNFFVRFGAGQPEALAEREERYRLGMPNSSGEAFPPLTNMEDNLMSEKLSANGSSICALRTSSQLMTKGKSQR